MQTLHYTAFIAVTGYALFLFVRVLSTRFAFIGLGKKEPAAKTSVKPFFVQVFGQKKLLKDKKSGWMHIIMFYGFIIVQFGAIELIVKGLIPGWKWPLGEGAHRLFSFMQEITVLLILFATAYAFYRRYIEKLQRLKRNFKAGAVLLLISSLMITVLLSLAFEKVIFSDPLSWDTPVSSLFALAFQPLPDAAATALFYTFWWLHLLILLTFLVYVPQSKHAHLIFAPYNWWVKDNSRPAGKLTAIDFERAMEEDAEEFGVGKIEAFTRRQLVDLYACVECGRCTSMCPASGTGKTLSPMDLIVKMRDHLTEKGAAVTSRTPWMPAFAMKRTKANRLAAQTDAAVDDVRLIGDVITEEELWACTTCRNCEDQCPVANEHVGHIIDMRRYLVMTEGNLPADARRALTNIERQSNPWGINRKERIKWREGMEDIVPTVRETEQMEYLLFVGSMGSFDKRSVKIARALASLLHRAGVSFAILGNEEKNSGDTARRLGNEMLFQELAMENIETFRRYRVKKVVTIDPHAFHTFKHEYPDFGLEDVEVYHHTEILLKLLQEGKLKPGKALNKRITYHDSCYLGRYNGMYDAPRRILSYIPGVEIAEMERSRENSMCCGAGGGMMWQEEKQGKRVNVERTEQALRVRPHIIGSACPYCLTMLSDGTKTKEVDAEVETKDIAEILYDAVIEDIQDKEATIR